MPTVRVEKVTQLTGRISEFEFSAADGLGLAAWTPGAHIDVELDGVGTRSYSLISWPGEVPEAYRITVQREEDGQGGSQAMHRLRQGATLPISDPKNDFELCANERQVVLLAGGIGVTPLISMATALSAAGRGFAFHYAGRSAGAMAYLGECRARFGSRFHAHFDDESPLDLSAMMAGAAEHDLYICGPGPMIDAARSAAEAAGIPPDNIHVELFATPPGQGADRPFEVELKSTGQVFTVEAGQSIIEALEAGGVDLMYDCQRGDCGICQTDVIDGVPEHRDVVLSQAEKESGKIMQICVSRALTDRLVLDL